MSARSERGLRLLSIDGGGIRGLSPLLMLKEILYRIQQESQLEKPPRPCDIFDLAGGTSTGGLIVIMLFRLEMSVDEAIHAYIRLAKHVFSAQKWFFQDGKFKASRLEDAIVTVIQETLKIGEVESRSVLMLEEKAPKCFVCAMPAKDLSRPTLFRSWTPVANPTYNCTLVEAARATSAAPTFFKAIELGDTTNQMYLDGGLRCNNPVKYVIDEAKIHFPSRPISCVISLGTGVADIIGLDRPDAFQRLFATNLIRVLKGIATDCEMRSEETARDAATQSFLYCRLNVDQGLQRVSLAEWEKLNDVQLHTSQYLGKHEVGQKVDRLVQVLKADIVSTTPRTQLSEEDCRAINKLEKSIAMSAYHDSNERSASSGCLEGTRQKQIKTIMKWIESEDEKKPAFLVLGPAGSGKTSLLNKIAENCKGKGCYAAGFFFSGTDSARNTTARFLNTIVYQVSVAIPLLQPYIARIIAADSTILSRSLGSQITTLLLEPLHQLRLDFPSFCSGSRSFVIVVDALDECGSLEEQRRVIAALAEVLSDGSFPLVCLLTSRFNPHIEHEIATTLAAHIQGQVVLGQDGDAERADIRAYLGARLDRIRNKHAFGKRIPKEWPLESDLQNIVKKSGGQFIYASTIIGYIESPEHNPHERLRYMLGISGTKLGEEPFAELDALYLALMSSVKNRAATIEILGIELVRSSSQIWTPQSMKSFDFEGHFRSLDGDIVLAPLASVLKYQDGRITFYHLSFAEFLLTSTRSQDYFVRPMIWQKWIVSQLVPHFYKRSKIDDSDTVYLIKEATRGTDLHQAINDGIALVTNHPKYLPSGGDFNIWPFVTSLFFLQLGFCISINKMADIFVQQGENVLPLSVLIKLACATNHTNSFFLFELCRTFAALQKSGIIEPRSLSDFPFWGCSSSRLSLAMTYLTGYLDDRIGQGDLFPYDYISASLRCLWYLQSSTCDIRSSLTEQLHSLGPRIGTSNYGTTYYDTSDLSGTSDSGITVCGGTFTTTITPDHFNSSNFEHYLNTSNSHGTIHGDMFIPSTSSVIYRMLTPLRYVTPSISNVTIHGGTFITTVDTLNPSNTLTPPFHFLSSIEINDGTFFSLITPNDLNTSDCLSISNVTIHGGTFAIFITPDYVDTSDYLGASNYLKDPSTNLTRGALDALPLVLLHAMPSINLLAALKRPFDTDVLVRTPASCRNVLFSIHNYLMCHDPDYQYDMQIDLASKVGQDEPLPEFVEFLHQNT